MNNIFDVLNKIIGKENGKGYVYNINSIYKKYNFTDKQKRAIEIFLFEPNRENAIRSLKLTPKSYIFLRHYLQEEELIEEMIKIIENKKISRTYLKVLITNYALKDLLSKLKQSSCNDKIERFVKICTVEKYLR